MAEKRPDDFPPELIAFCCLCGALTELVGHGILVYQMLTGQWVFPQHKAVENFLQLSAALAFVAILTVIAVGVALLCYKVVTESLGVSFGDIIEFVLREADPEGWWSERFETPRKLVYGLLAFASIAGLFLGPALIAYSQRHGQWHPELGATCNAPGYSAGARAI